MKILAKSAPESYQLADKIDKGCEGIEIQLLKDFLEEANTAEHYFRKITDVKNVDVRVVHMPLVKGTDINLEKFSLPVYEKAFEKAVELSQMLSTYFKHKIILIIHNGFTLDQYETIPMLWNFILNKFEKMLKTYPDVEYAIENLLPMNYRDGKLKARNGFLFDNVDLANYMNDKFQTKAFGTVLDTCHYITTNRFIHYVLRKDYYNNLPDFSLEKVFEENKDLVKVFHLTNVKNLGYNPYEHGCIFEDNEDDLEFLQEFFRLYQKYELDAFITLEVFEEDYRDAQNFLKMKKLIDGIKK